MWTDLRNSLCDKLYEICHELNVCDVVWCLYGVKVAVLLGQSSSILTENLIQLLHDDSTEVCCPPYPTV